MIGCTRPGTPHAKTECPVVHSKRHGVRRSFGPSGHGAKTKIETAREGDAAVLKRPLRFGMRRRVVWTRTERGREPSRVTLSTSPPPAVPKQIKPEPLRPRCAVLPEAIPNIRNARFAPNFRHHPGSGGHRSPCYVPIPISTAPGALSDGRRRGHFFAILGGKIPPSRQNRVCYCTPLPRRLPYDKTKQKILEAKIPRDEGSENYERGATRNSGRETRLWAGK
jgi:hypothetical protein